MATGTTTPKVLSRRRQPAAPAILNKSAQNNTYVGTYMLLQSRRSSLALAKNAPALRLSAINCARTEAPTIHPTYLRRALAYVANGSLPPLPRIIPAATLNGLLSFAMSTAACLALGVLIGQGVAR